MSAQQPGGIKERITAWFEGRWDRFIRNVEQQRRRDRRRGVDPIPAQWDSGFGVVDMTPFAHGSRSSRRTPHDE